MICDGQRYGRRASAIDKFSLVAPGQGRIQKFLKEGAQSYKILERGGQKSLKMAWIPILAIFL